MPIVRINGRLIYFAHVPKCAGSSVEIYLEKRFGTLAFKDSSFNSLPARRRWSKSSPQHVPLEALDRLFPAGFFDNAFALVRHPVDRLASAYLFQREIENTVPPDLPFADWIGEVHRRRSRSPFAYDNHVRPSVDFIPEDAAVFRMEDGLGPVLDWLDAQAGDRGGPREIAAKNVLSDRLSHQKRPPVSFRVAPEERARIHGLYAADYERFGYDPDAPTRY